MKAFVEQAGLNLTCVRDRAEGKTYPYVAIREGVSKVPSTASTPFEMGGKRSIREMVQLDLYQQWKKPDGTMAEVYGLGDALADVLDGSVLLQSGSGAPPTHVYGVKVIQGPMRFPDLEPNIIRDTITIEIDRDRT